MTGRVDVAHTRRLCGGGERRLCRPRLAPRDRRRRPRARSLRGGARPGRTPGRSRRLPAQSLRGAGGGRRHRRRRCPGPRPRRGPGPGHGLDIVRLFAGRPPRARTAARGGQGRRRRSSKRLAWSDLTDDERRFCPPVFVVAHRGDPRRSRPGGAGGRSRRRPAGRRPDPGGSGLGAGRAPRGRRRLRLDRRGGPSGGLSWRQRSRVEGRRSCGPTRREPRAARLPGPTPPSSAPRAALEGGAWTITRPAEEAVPPPEALPAEAAASGNGDLAALREQHAAEIAALRSGYEARLAAAREDLRLEMAREIRGRLLQLALTSRAAARRKSADDGIW